MLKDADSYPIVRDGKTGYKDNRLKCEEGRGSDRLRVQLGDGEVESVSKSRPSASAVVSSERPGVKLDSVFLTSLSADTGNEDNRRSRKIQKVGVNTMYG